MIRHTLQSLTALTAVLGLYLAPWSLTLLDATPPPPAEVVASPTRAVVWQPPTELPAPPPPIEPQPERRESPTPAVEEVAASTEVAPEAETLAIEPPDTVPARTRPQQRRRSQRLTAEHSPRARPSPRARAPRPEPTRREQRRRDRWERKQERLARQPQCRDLIDQMIHVRTEKRESMWMVGSELVRCYREHPGQFVNLGGMDWSHDAKGRKEGLVIYVSKRDRGDVARAIGLERGDVLKSLNGVSLRNPATATLALTQLTRDRARLVFERDGERHVLSVSVVEPGVITSLASVRAQIQGLDGDLARAGAPADR